MSISLKDSSNKESGECQLAAGADMTIYSAANNHEVLVGHFADYSSFDIDLSAVEEIDCSGIQLLLALKHSAEKESKSLVLSSVSDATAEVMNVLNIKDQFTWPDK